MTITDTLRRAAALHAQGNLRGALAEAGPLLPAHPDNATLLQFLGVLHCQTGDRRTGTELLRRAVNLNPADVGVRINLARALLDDGRLEEAERVCAASGVPPSSDLLRMRADILKAQQRWTEAIACYEQLVSEAPDDFGSWNNLGNARHELGDIDGALVALERARSLQPEAATPHLNIGRVLATSGRHEESVRAFAEAARRAPRDPAALTDLAKGLNRIGRSAEALLPIADAARANPRDPEIFFTMGLVFANLADLGKAEQAYRFAIQADPHYAPAYLNLGILLEQSNRLDDLRQLLGQGSAKLGAAQELDYLKALVLRRDGKLAEALELARSTRPDTLDPGVQAHFVGQVADLLNLPAISFEAFEEMNRHAASGAVASHFSGTEATAEVERLAGIVDPQWVSAWPEVATIEEPAAPVFLVGFLRSGTTLLDTILMGHPDTQVLEEEPLLSAVGEALGDMSRLAQAGPDQVADLRARYFDEFGKVQAPKPGKLLIDKNPLALLRAPLIYRLFPDAKFIFALRHPCDVVLSCFMQNFKVNQAMASFLDLGNAARYYASVMDFWQRCQDSFPLQVHQVRYESMVADVEGEMRLLLDFLGLPWDAQILDHRRTAAERGYIRTPSYSQVTERIYERSRGRWTRYRAQMEPVLPILQPWVERFGYALD